MDILELLKNQLSPGLIAKIANAVGIDPETAQKLVGGALPALLAGFAGKAQAGGFSAIESSLGNLPSMGDATEAMSALDDPNQAVQVAGAGRSMLDGVFGEKLDGIGGWLSSQFGLDKTKALAMLASVAPVVLGFLKKMSGGDLLGFLKGMPDLSAAMPAGLAGAMGLGSMGDIPKVETPRVETPRPSTTTTTADTGGGIPAWLWLIPLAAIAGWFFWRAMQPAEDMATTGPKTTMEQNNVETPDGDMSATLPDGTVLNFPAGSVEDKLIAFIQDESKPVDETTWFTFDRLEFDTGAATIRAESQERIEAISKILKAFPAVHLKIGGYTDNTGSADANLTLSQQRAEATMNALTALGIGAERLEAEGYGQEHPVADNATEEGRQRNRRIDVRVTQK